MANTPIPVTTNINIKVPVNLKLQLRGHTGTLIFTQIYPMYLRFIFFKDEIKKIILSEFFSNLAIIFFLPVL